MSGDLPIEQYVFHFGPLADVMNDHVASCQRRFLIDNDPDVRDSTSQIPGYKVPRGIVLNMVAGSEALALAAEENHEIGDSSMIDVRICACEEPSPIARIGGEITYHIFVNFFL